jgi:hypothetical protein
MHKAQFTLILNLLDNLKVDFIIDDTAMAVFYWFITLGIFSLLT